MKLLIFILILAIPGIVYQLACNARDKIDDFKNKDNYDVNYRLKRAIRDRDVYNIYKYLRLGATSDLLSIKYMFDILRPCPSYYDYAQLSNSEEEYNKELNEVKEYNNKCCEVIDMLLSKGYTINDDKDFLFRNFLADGKNYHPEAAKLLLKHGVDIDKDCLLHGEIKFNSNIQNIYFLLENGASIYKKDKNGQTPIDLARKGPTCIYISDTQERHREVIEALLNYGAKPKDFFDYFKSCYDDHYQEGFVTILKYCTDNDRGWLYNFYKSEDKDVPLLGRVTFYILGNYLKYGELPEGHIILN